MRTQVTLAEIAAVLAAAQDRALGQPRGSQLRAAVLGPELAMEAGADPDGTGDHLVDLGAALPGLHRPRLRHGRGVR